MKKNILFAVLLASSTVLQAADEDPTAKFREALRDAMLKLRDAQGQLANAQAAQYAAEAKATELAAKSDNLAKELAEERNTSTNKIAELTKTIAERDGSILELTAALQKWKTSYGQVTQLASKRESQRAQLEAANQKLQRQLEDQQAKNIEMYHAAMEVLERYEKFGFGDALLAREPFTAAQRVKFQNLVQDLTDKIAAARSATDEVKKN
jgi:chromosome segregation ATPase